MNWFKNLRVRTKILASFMLVLTIAIAAGTFTVVEMQAVNTNYSDAMYLTSDRIGYIFEADSNFARARMIMREIYYPNNDRARLETLSVEVSNELDQLTDSLNNLHDIAAEAVQKKIEGVLPQIEQYRKDTNEIILHLLAIDDVSLGNPEYQAAMVQAQDMAAAITNSYAKEMVATINSIPDMALGVLRNLSDENQKIANRDMYISIVVYFVMAVITVCIAFYLPTLISRPLVALATFMEKAGATGDLVLNQNDIKTIGEMARVKDEIGLAITGAAGLVKHVSSISEELKRIADGDLTIEINPLSDVDTMGNSMKSVVENLNNMFGEIQMSTRQVSAGSKQVADGAQSLAQGATEQAASIQELSSSISDIAERTKINADKAERTSKLSEIIKDSAEKGSRQMDEMMTAVQDINDASQSISKIIKTIDDIAFQTNILALNAAVEAARAGQHGKGFAVVAEEVRNLAAKSAEAAKETGNMIQNSMKKAEYGSCIAGETASSLSEIVAGINESSSLIEEIARDSEEQSNGISDINIGIDQVAQVVQQNSATAEESAAASQEMNNQSAMLTSLISNFQLKGAARTIQPGGVSARRGNAPNIESISYLPNMSFEDSKYAV